MFDAFLEFLTGGRSAESPYLESKAPGLMYESDPARLERKMRNLLDGLESGARSGVLKGLMVPQSELDFSGKMAARGYAQFENPETVDRVIVVASSKMVPFEGMAVTRAPGVQTPLGSVSHDPKGIDTALNHEQVRVIEPAFEPDLAIDIQLPFLQSVFSDFDIIPLLVGDAEPASVAEVLEQLWGGTETRIVLSANLSEGYAPEKAHKLDRQLVERIEDLNPEGIRREQSLSRVAIQGIVEAAGRKGLEAEVFDRGDSAHALEKPVEKVAGYASIGFYESPSNRSSSNA